MEAEVIKIEYLRKSLKIYKFYLGLFLFSISMTFFAKPVLKESNTELLDLLIALPILLFFVLVPVGLYYSWKSYKRKEGLAIVRFKYFIGHLFFALLALGFIVTLISDLKQIL